MTRLTTERLLLRPMSPEDEVPLLGVFGDPKVMHAFDRGPFTPDEMRAWVGRNLEHQDRLGFGLFTVVLRETGEVIGDCGLERMELEGREETELGYDVAAAHWGHGYATEAAVAVIAYARRDLGIDRLVSLVRAGNERSARVAERAGMSLERELEMHGIGYALYAIG